MRLRNGNVHSAEGALSEARAYLIKQKIPYRELIPNTEHYYNKVRPAVHR